MYLNPEVINLGISQSDTCQLLLDVNAAIHKSTERWEWHLKHILLTERYAHIINQRLGEPVSYEVLSQAALGHDLLKDKYLHSSTAETYATSVIPKDLNRYVRSNLDILEEFMLDDYFNTDITLHALSAGIWMHTEMRINDYGVLYGVFFHSCPIIPVYNELTEDIQTVVDIIMLADKLSSNYMRINDREGTARIDLDLSVFGPTGTEFNYTTGLLMARLIGYGKSKEINGYESLQYYTRRARSICPLVSKQYSISKLGGARHWAKRESPVLTMPLKTLST